MWINTYLTDMLDLYTQHHTVNDILFICFHDTQFYCLFQRCNKNLILKWGSEVEDRSYLLYKIKVSFILQWKCNIFPFIVRGIFFMKHLKMIYESVPDSFAVVALFKGLIKFQLQRTTNTVFYMNTQSLLFVKCI